MQSKISVKTDGQLSTYSTQGNHEFYEALRDQLESISERWGCSYIKFDLQNKKSELYRIICLCA